MKRKRLMGSDEGIVSIIVTIVLMVIVTLIVIGFSQVARREQRQALDRQLSTQANYAAESGINDAIAAIQNNSYTSDKTNCNAAPGISSDQNVDPSSSIVSYTCLLIKQKPPTLEYSDISQDSLTNTTFSADCSPACIKYLDIYWQDKDGGTGIVSGNTKTFPAYTAWPADTGVLRVSVTGIYGSNYSRSALNFGSATIFLYPNQSGTNTFNHSAFTNVSNSGAILSGNCSPATTPRICKATVVFAASPSKILLQLKSIYKDSGVTAIIRNSAGTQLNFVGGQAQIDATGKANDVTRRIQVRVPLNSNSKYPNVAVQSLTGICKKFNTYPGTNGTAVDISAGVYGNPGGICAP